MHVNDFAVGVGEFAGDALGDQPGDFCRVHCFVSGKLLLADQRTGKHAGNSDRAGSDGVDANVGGFALTSEGQAQEIDAGFGKRQSGPKPGKGSREAAEEMLTITPPPPFFMIGQTALVK